jgi:hypothetical protein
LYVQTVLALAAGAALPPHRSERTRRRIRDQPPHQLNRRAQVDELEAHHPALTDLTRRSQYLLSDEP